MAGVPSFWLLVFIAALGSAIGGWLTQSVGWRWMYGVIAGGSSIVLLVAVFRLVETLPKSTDQQVRYSFAQALKGLLSDRQFLAPILVTGNFIAGRWSVKIGAERMVKLGSIPIFISIALAWLLSPWPLAIALFIPAFAFAMSNGICIPNLTSIVLGVRPEYSGTASGLMGVAQLGVGVVLSSILGLILKDSAIPLFAMMTLSLSIAVIGFLIWKPISE